METKDQTKQSVEKTNEVIKECMRQKDICTYQVGSVISAIVFIGLMVSVYLFNPIQPDKIDDTLSIILKLFSMIILSLLFFWWMKFLSKLISDCREAMKPWQKKVSDTYSFLVDMEMMLHKAKIENEKKKIEKEGQEPNPVETELPTNKIKELVKKEMENVIKEAIVEKATIEWTLKIKQEKEK